MGVGVMMKEEGKTDIKVTRKDMEEFRKTHNDTITLSLQEWVYVQAALEYCSTIITNEFHDELKNIYLLCRRRQFQLRRR